MPHKEPVHRAWNVPAHDDEGRGLDLRLAVEQTGERGYAAYAYWDRKPEDQDEMIVAQTDHASSGPEAFRALRRKLENERGVMLEEENPPNWLFERDWDESTLRSHDREMDDWA